MARTSKVPVTAPDSEPTAATGQARRCAVENSIAVTRLFLHGHHEVLHLVTRIHDERLRRVGIEGSRIALAHLGGVFPTSMTCGPVITQWALSVAAGSWLLVPVSPVII